MRSLRIALLQANFRSSFPEKIPAIKRIARPCRAMRPDDYEFNHRLLIKLARNAAEKGAELLVSPESYLDGWSYELGSFEKVAITIPGPQVKEHCLLAKQLGVWMCVAALEKRRGAIYNSAVLISSRGTIEGVYRKTHETRDVMARSPYTLGNDLPVFSTPWGKAGILICHDRWYPENGRTLRLKGADFILNPTASAVCSPHHKYYDIHRCVLRAQAYQNSLFWVNCNSANHGGCSVVLGPEGSVVAEGGGEEEIIFAHLQPRSHDQYDFLANLRPKLYARSGTKAGSRVKSARRMASTV